jgi:hypothetical protein
MMTVQVTLVDGKIEVKDCRKNNRWDPKTKENMGQAGPTYAFPDRLYGTPGQHTTIPGNRDCMLSGRGCEAFSWRVNWRLSSVAPTLILALRQRFKHRWLSWHWRAIACNVREGSKLEATDGWAHY